MTALATAFGLFLLAARMRLLPPLDTWMIQLAALGFLVCVCLALASVGNAALKIFLRRNGLVIGLIYSAKRERYRTTFLA